MAIKNLGNFKKTIGLYEMKLDNGIILEFKDGYSGEDLIEFSEVLNNKKKDSDNIETVKKMREFILKHLKKNDMFDETWKEGDVSRFVIENIRDLMKGYFVMFNITDEEGFEKIMKSAQDQIKNKDKGDEDKSPIEQDKNK